MRPGEKPFEELRLDRRRHPPTPQTRRFEGIAPEARIRIQSLVGWRQLRNFYCARKREAAKRPILVLLVPE